MWKLAAALILAAACSAPSAPLDATVTGDAAEAHDGASFGERDGASLDERDATSTRGTVVGPAGGVVSGDGILLRIPAGALTAEVEITIDSLPRPTYEGIGAVGPEYELGPAGLDFAVPVTVAMQPDTAAEEIVAFWTTRDTGEYALVPSERQADGSVRFEVEHFSRGLLGALLDFTLTGLMATACRVPPSMGMCGEPCCAQRCFGEAIAGQPLECTPAADSITGDRCIPAEGGFCGGCPDRCTPGDTTCFSYGEWVCVTPEGCSAGSGDWENTGECFPGEECSGAGVAGPGYTPGAQCVPAG